jgi:Na+-translocating ferredoxin:NAD+ oxidoreductase RnfG subunit
VVGKNIDSISGATISVNAITADIALKTSILKNQN